MKYEEKRKNYIDNAKRTLKDHRYTLLTKQNGCEVWRCGRPNSNMYAFNIALLPMGICVMGDIGELTFNVSRPLGFLAGRDVEYYIHSKLSHESRETEYDDEGIKESVADRVKDVFADNEDLWDLFSEEEFCEIAEKIEHMSFIELDEFCKKLYHDTDVSHKGYDFLDDLQEFLGDVKCLNNDRDAYELLDNCKVIEFYDCFEYGFNKPSESLIRRLYLINQASVAILQQIKDENTKKYINQMGLTYEN